MASKWKAVPQSLLESMQATKTEHRRLGASGLYVSSPILGCMGIGCSAWDEWVLDEEKALPLLKAAYDRGLNTWDTANVYSNGRSEEIIGKALDIYKIPRHKVVIMTKCYRIMVDTDNEPNNCPVAMLEKQALRSKDYVNSWGLSRGAIFHAVDESLRRLNTDYIDVLQIHRFDYNVTMEETMEALHDLIKMGKVRYIGASSMLAHEFVMLQSVAERNGWSKFISMQNQYSLLYREEEREMNKYCDRTGVGLIPWGVLAYGQLAREPAINGKTTRSRKELADPRFDVGVKESDKEIIKRVCEVAEKRGWPVSHVALAWINKRVTAPIIGLNSVARLDEALEALSQRLTDEEETYLEELYEPKKITVGILR